MSRSADCILRFTHSRPYPSLVISPCQSQQVPSCFTFCIARTLGSTARPPRLAQVLLQNFWGPSFAFVVSRHSGALKVLPQSLHCFSIVFTSYPQVKRPRWPPTRVISSASPDLKIQFHQLMKFACALTGGVYGARVDLFFRHALH